MEYRPYTAYDPSTGAVFFPKILKGFPYPTRHCPFCNEDCSIINALHVTDTPEIFKAIFMCENTKCNAYDLLERQCYLRVYYSCDEALELFETVFLRFERIEKD